VLLLLLLLLRQLPLLVEVLHWGFLQLLVMVGVRLLLHLLADIQMLLAGRLVVLLLVL
jgi:hypothetical protein